MSRRLLIPGRPRRWSDVWPQAAWRIPLNRLHETTTRLDDMTAEVNERMDRLVTERERQRAEREKAARDARLRAGR